VKMIDGSAELEERQSGKKLLRLRITAEVNGVRDDSMGYVVMRADAPGGREADAERLATVVKAITGKEPKIRRMKDGKIMIECGREHLEGFRRFAELADAIEEWLEETGR
jgi:hypothetical protein